MPSANEEFEKLRKIIEAGGGEKRVTPAIVVADAAKARIAKPKPGQKAKTVFIFHTDSNDCFRALNFYKDKTIAEVGNKAIAIELLIRAWKVVALNKPLRDRWVEEGHLGPHHG